METKPKYSPRNHKYDPFQKRLGNETEKQKMPPKTLFITPELFYYYKQKAE